MSDEERITKPTLETILERINEMRTEFNVRLSSVENETREFRAEMNEFRAEMNEFRAETNAAIAKLEDRVDILSADINKLRADIKRINERIYALEKEPA